jgi:hypothetical protein
MTRETGAMRLTNDQWTRDVKTGDARPLRDQYGRMAEAARVWQTKIDERVKEGEKVETKEKL